MGGCDLQCAPLTPKIDSRFHKNKIVSGTVCDDCSTQDMLPNIHFWYPQIEDRNKKKTSHCQPSKREETHRSVVRPYHFLRCIGGAFRISREVGEIIRKHFHSLSSQVSCSTLWYLQKKTKQVYIHSVGFLKVQMSDVTSGRNTIYFFGLQNDLLYLSNKPDLFKVFCPDFQISIA